MIRYVSPKSGKPKQEQLPFSLKSLRVLAWAIDPAAVRLSLRHMAGENPCPVDEALALKMHEEARHLMVDLFQDMENKISPKTDPMVLLTLLMEKHVAPNMPDGRPVPTRSRS